MNKLIYLAVILMMIPSALALEATVNNYDPTPAEAGDFVNVWIKVENPSEDKIDELSVEIIPKDGLRLSSGESATQRIGILNAGSAQTVQFRLFVEDDAVEGPNFMEVQLVQAGGRVTFDLSIEVEEEDRDVVALDIGNIQSDPTRIKPDDEFVKLEVTIQNLGDATARGTKTILQDLPEGISFSESFSNLELLGNIEEDGTSVATFFIDVDEEVLPGEYVADLEASYKYKPDEDKDDFLLETVHLPVRISIKAIPLYEITMVAFQPSELRAGDQVKMTLSVKNVGTEKGESVRLKVFGKSEQPFDFDISSNFLAPSLEPGEEAQTTLEFGIDKNAPVQIYLLDLEIKNIVNDDVITYDKKVAVDVVLPRQNSPVIPVGMGVALLIVVVVGLQIYRRRSRKKRSRKVKHTYEKSQLD